MSELAGTWVNYEPDPKYQMSSPRTIPCPTCDGWAVEVRTMGAADVHFVCWTCDVPELPRPVPE